MIQKNQTKKRDFHITIASNGKVVQTVAVSAESVREALKGAYSKICGWQAIDPEDLDTASIP